MKNGILSVFLDVRTKHKNADEKNTAVFHSSQLLLCSGFTYGLSRTLSLTLGLSHIVLWIEILFFCRELKTWNNLLKNSKTNYGLYNRSQYSQGNERCVPGPSQVGGLRGDLAPPQFFAKQLTLSQPRGLGHQIWCFENESTFEKWCWLHPLSCHGD